MIEAIVISSKSGFVASSASDNGRNSNVRVYESCKKNASWHARKLSCRIFWMDLSCTLASGPCSLFDGD